MIDRDSDAGSWLEAMAPDHRSIKALTDRELQDPRLPENVARWHGLSTMQEARDMIADEKLRRVEL